MTHIQQQLLSLADPVYREFQCKLMPTVPPESVIGVRTPVLRRLAKQISGTPECDEFLAGLPHKYYDENNLHGFLIEGLTDYSEVISRIDEFLPHIDNWATCDLLSPKCFAKHLPELSVRIKDWLRSDRVYTVRFGIVMLIRRFLDDGFAPEQLDMAAGIKPGEYYIDMAAAWYFATALAKHYETTLPFLTQRRLSAQVHNKTIRKAIESFRIPGENKDYLRTLKLNDAN